MKWEILQDAVKLLRLTDKSIELIFWKDVDCNEHGSLDEFQLLQFSSQLFDINDDACLKSFTYALVEAVETLLTLANEEMSYTEGAEHLV